MNLSSSWRYQLPALKTFEAVARTGSGASAAEELHVTPGAVSQQVRQLEAFLQVQLFSREHRKLVLTDDGRLLSARLTESFAGIERVIADLCGRPDARKLRLKVTPTFAIRWLIPRLVHFFQKYPDFEVEVGTYQRQDDVHVEDVDFIVRHGDGHWKDGACDFIFGDELNPVCSPETALRLQQPSDLKDHCLLHSLMRTDSWDGWFENFALQAARPQRSLKLANAAVTYQAAIDGMGVALAQLRYVQNDLASGRLVMPFKRLQTTDAGYYLVCAKHKVQRAPIKLFREWIATVAHDDTGASGPR